VGKTKERRKEREREEKVRGEKIKKKEGKERTIEVNNTRMFP